MSNQEKDDLFYLCSLIEYIARKTKNHRGDVVKMIGKEELNNLYKLASVNHCLSFEQVSDEVIEKNNMGEELIKSGKYHELTGVSGATSVVGCYNYQGQTVLYVTNNSYSKNGTVTLSFDQNYGYEIYQGGKKKESNGKEISLDLLPGEGVLVMPKY